MPVTYDKIASTTLGSASATIDFTSIPATYTDLVIHATLGSTSGTVNFGLLTFNNDTSALYSNLGWYTSYSGAFPGTSIQGSGAYANLTAFYINLNSQIPSTISTGFTLNIQNYTSTSIFKSILSKYSNKYEVNLLSGIYRSTSAINRITLNASGGSGTFATGTTITIYGILAA